MAAVANYHAIRSPAAGSSVNAKWAGRHQCFPCIFVSRHDSQPSFKREKAGRRRRVPFPTAYHCNRLCLEYLAHVCRRRSERLRIHAQAHGFQHCCCISDKFCSKPLLLITSPLVSRPPARLWVLSAISFLSVDKAAMLQSWWQQIGIGAFLRAAA